MNVESFRVEPRQHEPRILQLWSEEDARRALHREARTGLTASPKELSPRWLYDARGAHLFELITTLPEYYPTRCELQILKAHAKDISRRSGAEALIELGSGTSAKTLTLLDAFTEARQLTHYTPFDVCVPVLEDAAAQLLRRYPTLEVEAIAGDFERHLDALPAHGRRMVAFLGGTVGNLKPHARQAFLGKVAGALERSEWLLLGVDLIKDRGLLHAAYNDSRGVTAEFNLNVLNVLNRELHAQFIPDHFRHLARFDEDNGWVEMLLQSTQRQSIPIAELGITARFEQHEVLRTEVSTKFTPQQVEAELADAGFGIREWWTDDLGHFALTLAEKL